MYVERSYRSETSNTAAELSMNQSEKVDLLFAAIVKLQGKIEGAKKDASNPFFNSRYADLESCWEAVRLPLQECSLCVIQMGGIEAGEPGLYTTVGHTSGQYMTGFMPLTMKTEDPQAQGSAITYNRRYSLCAALGLIQIDDDAEKAMNSGPRPQMSTTQSQPQQSVESQQGPKPIPRWTPPTPVVSHSCSHCNSLNTMVDRYNQNELYCKDCKKKTPLL